MKYWLVFLIALTGCYHQESKSLSEDATVVDVIYQPANHSEGIGYDMTGKGGLSIVSTDFPEKYAIVFKCYHGKFIIEGKKDSNAYQQWLKLKPGEEVSVQYQEVYEVSDKDANDRKLVKLHFVDAIQKASQ